MLQNEVVEGWWYRMGGLKDALKQESTGLPGERPKFELDEECSNSDDRLE